MYVFFIMYMYNISSCIQTFKSIEDVNKNQVVASQVSSITEVYSSNAEPETVVY